MTRILSNIAAVLLLALLIVPQTAAQQSEEDLIAMFNKQNEKMEKAMMESDMDYFMDQYCKIIMSLPSYEKPTYGLDAMKKMVEEYEPEMEIHSFNATATDVISTENMRIEIGTYKINMTVPQMPEPINDHGKYMNVWVQPEEGVWKLAVETWNTDMNPWMPPAPPTEESN